MYLQKPQFCVIAERMNKDITTADIPTTPRLVAYRSHAGLGDQLADYEGSAVRDGPDALPDPVPALWGSRAFYHCPYEQSANTDSKGAMAADDRHWAC